MNFDTGSQMLKRLVATILALIPLAATAPDGFSAESRAFQIEEREGIRRFGYPVATILNDVPNTSSFRYRLLHEGKAVAAQFQPRNHDAAGKAQVMIDFPIDLFPFQSKQYVVEYGPDVEAGPLPRSGMKVEETDDEYRVTHLPHLTWRVPKNLCGLLRSIASPKTDYLRSASPGFWLQFGDETPVLMAPANSQRVVVSGPLCSHLEFHATNQVGETNVNSTVELQFPSTKSWIQVAWSIDDPADQVRGIGIELNLNTDKSPTTIDFGAGSLVYAQLTKGMSALLRAGPRSPASNVSGQASAAPLWETLRGPTGKLEPFVVASKQFSNPAEGWVHVMDQERCSAVAVADFGVGTADRFEVANDGRLQFWKQFSRADSNSTGKKTLLFWLHVVGMPPHVTAGTSPQSMQSPLECVWRQKGS